MADNLKNYGSFIPGYRPGRRTADYLEKVMVRITYVGAGFLSVLAIIPTLFRRRWAFPFVRRLSPAAQLADRRERGFRPGEEDRQSPRDAELQGVAGKRVIAVRVRSVRLTHHQPPSPPPPLFVGVVPGMEILRSPREIAQMRKAGLLVWETSTWSGKWSSRAWRRSKSTPQ